MVELRKRKAPAETAAAPPTKKSNPVKAAHAKEKTAVDNKGATPSNGNSLNGKLSMGSTIDLEGFGGEVQTNDGEETTLKKLVEASEAGVILFTYPKASTPGCTTQACLFRDEFTPLTATGFSIYGLSMDSPKSNTTFKTKQNLPYTLLCDPSATLIGAIGMKKASKGSTTRGVFVVNKEGKVLAVEAGGPGATVEVVRNIVKDSEPSAKGTTSEDVETIAEDAKAENEQETGMTDAPEIEPSTATNGDQEKEEDADLKEDTEKADVAADVADSAEKLDKAE